MTEELEMKELSAPSPEQALQLWQHWINERHEKL
jgi:hypothetical protein